MDGGHGGCPREFAAPFEASVKQRRFARGQTIDGTIVALGREVGLVDVGGTGEAESARSARLPMPSHAMASGAAAAATRDVRLFPTVRDPLQQCGELFEFAFVERLHDACTTGVEVGE